MDSLVCMPLWNLYNVSGFGMLWRIVAWHGVPVAWHGDYGDREGKWSINLEDVANKGLHIRHIFWASQVQTMT